MSNRIYADNWTSHNLVCSECGYPTLHRCKTCDEGCCVECSNQEHQCHAGVPCDAEAALADRQAEE